MVTGQGAAFPPAIGQRAAWDGYFASHYGHDRKIERIFLGCGVRARHAAVDPRADDVSGWTTGARMRRYVAESAPLGRDAVARALADAGLAAADVGLFVVASCTGYATPGLDIVIAGELGMPAHVRRLLVGHMGCYAAIPALGAAADFVRARGSPAVVLCAELTSLHLQPPSAEPDLGQVVTHALFGDAAAAVVVEPDGAAGLEVLDTAAMTDAGSAGLMTWEVTDHGFRMGLSPKVPDVLATHVDDAVAGLLAPFGLAAGDVAGWAIHPGGPRIVDVVAERLGLRPSQTAATRDVLARRGNCSSATTLLVLDRLRRDQPPGAAGHVVAMAFGPGLTLCAALLRAR
ncbi:type III polyketide synthase [Frankia sp. CNm7]|uniref:Type III polyketide synthase n=1 Tax=Frankia nepalensis TaxID=1836974 RepID=A0A937UQ11_9ACTN|nr:type III polyketide synthase [Frankia nepalensis]MBL7508611.1 type III polyketide synthase [Frankia nepalensis]MBL7517471.1 type III polyketide synthase [Frankia nepalensis]MBL7629717.1 type III polyketide synthase [Frankia nepalensis]